MKPSETTISLPVRNEKGPSGSGATTVKEKENDGDCEIFHKKIFPSKMKVKIRRIQEQCFI